MSTRNELIRATQSLHCRLMRTSRDEPDKQSELPRRRQTNYGEAQQSELSQTLRVKSLHLTAAKTQTHAQGRKTRPPLRSWRAAKKATGRAAESPKGAQGPSSPMAKLPGTRSIKSSAKGSPNTRDAHHSHERKPEHRQAPIRFLQAGAFKWAEPSELEPPNHVETVPRAGEIGRCKRRRRAVPAPSATEALVDVMRTGEWHWTKCLEFRFVSCVEKRLHD